MLGQLSGFCDKIQNMKNMNEETSLEIKKKNSTFPPGRTKLWALARRRQIETPESSAIDMFC